MDAVRRSSGDDVIRRAWRRFYGADWRRYRAAIIAAHGPFCSVCGRRVEKYLNLAHISHDPRSSEVRLMCPADHARHDARQSYAMRRRNAAKRSGQRWLWPEVADAPYQAWARRGARPADERQGGLF